MTFPAHLGDLVPVILRMGPLDAVSSVAVCADGDIGIVVLDQRGAMDAFRVGAEDVLVAPAASFRTL